MLKSVVTPFNVFSLFSFILLVTIAVLVHGSPLPKFGLAAASAFCGFILIGTFLVWTMLQGD
jgi:hypothetical protein